MQKKFFSIVIIDLPSLFLSTGGRVIHVSVHNNQYTSLII